MKLFVTTESVSNIEYFDALFPGAIETPKEEIIIFGVHDYKYPKFITLESRENKSFAIIKEIDITRDELKEKILEQDPREEMIFMTIEFEKVSEDKNGIPTAIGLGYNEIVSYSTKANVKRNSLTIDEMIDEMLSKIDEYETGDIVSIVHDFTGTKKKWIKH